MAQKLALIIGNNSYDDASLSRLTAPGADVQAFAEVLRAPDICKFDEVIPLVDEGCAVVRRAIARFYDQRRRDDLLLLYFSGHGVKDENGHLYLALRDTESSLLAGTAIEASFITGRMDRSASKRLVLILDCCHSGAFAAGSKAVQGGTVGTATAFEGRGRIVLTATDATQYAWEGNRILGDAQTSLFTRFMIEGLKTGAADRDENGVITVDELYEYVYEKVLDATPAQTPGKWAWLNGQIVLVDNAGAKRIARAAEHLAAARAAIERKQFAAALEWLRQVSELNPAAEGVADLVRCANEGLAAAEAAERLRLEIAQKNDEARRQLARQNFSTARLLVEDSLRRDPENADCRKLLGEIRHDELVADVESDLQRGSLESAEQALTSAEVEFAGDPILLKLRARLTAAIAGRRALEEARAAERLQENLSSHRDAAGWTRRARLVSGAAATLVAALLVSGAYKFVARSTSSQPPVVATPATPAPVNPPAADVTPPQPAAEPPSLPRTDAVLNASDHRAAEIATAVTQARQQLARGDRDGALRTAGSALALDVNNQAAQTLLNDIVKDAQRRAAHAAGAAERAGAPPTAIDVRAAEQAQGDARRLGRAGDYDGAARKYWDAAELFERAARSTQTTVAAAAERANPGVPAPDRAPAETAAAPPEPRHAPAPPAPSPNAHAAPPVAAPPAAASSTAADSDSVLQVLHQYQAAFNRLDAAGVARIVPALDASQLARSFANLRSYQLDLVNPRVSVEGNIAEVTCVRNIAARPRVGSAQNVSGRATFRLRRSGATWIIDKVEDR